MTGWTTAWILWAAMFATIELPALLNKTPGDTLSEHIWTWFAIRNKPKQWRLRRAALLTGIAWLTLHLLTGGTY